MHWTRPAAPAPPNHNEKPEFDTDGFLGIYIYQRSGCTPGFLSRSAAHPQFFSPTSQPSGPAPLLSVLPHDTPYHHVPQSCSPLPTRRGSLCQCLGRSVAHSPAPESECEQVPRSFLITSYLDLTLVSPSPRTRGQDLQARPFIRPVLT